MRITKNRKMVVWVFVFFLGIMGSYALWNKLTIPPRLPLKNIKPGESLNFEFVKQLGGSVSSSQTKPIVMKGNLVYAGMGPRLAILDISNPSDISLVGQSDIIPDKIGEIVMVGDYVYIAPGIYGGTKGGSQELHILDVSNPKEPQYLAKYSPYGQKVGSVYVIGNYLYVTARNIDSDPYSSNKYLHILDISNPTDLKEIGHYDFNTGIFDLTTFENYIYVASNEPGLRVLDISSPQDPKEFTILYPTGRVHKLIVSGNYLYLSGSIKGTPSQFHALDISNPRQPVEIGVQKESDALQSSIYQNIAYFWSGGAQRTISFVDISNPKEPRNIAIHEFDGRVVSVQENVAFVMDAHRLVLFDLSNPLKPVELGSYITLTPDDTLPEFYLAETKGIMPVSTDMFILDFSKPLSPVIANRYLVGYGYAVESVHKEFVYMVSTKGIQVLDILDPTEPAIVWRHDRYDKNDKPFILATAEKYAYLINPTDGFYVYDITNSGNPTLISHQPDLKGFDSFDDFAAMGNYLYILDGRELHILDASDPTTIAEVSLYKFPSNQSGYRRIKIIDDLAFLDNSLYDGTDPATLTILNMSDPVKPSVITSYYWGEYSAIRGDSKQTVFINDYTGLHVIDFSNPRKPREIGYYGIDQYGTSPYGLELGQDNLVYMVGYPNGLYVLRYLPPSE